MLYIIPPELTIDGSSTPRNDRPLETGQEIHLRDIPRGYQRHIIEELASAERGDTSRSRCQASQEAKPKASQERTET